MKKNIKVSVVVVTYNGLRYIDKCVSSVLKSNYPDFEVVVVDNGSIDSTAQILKDKYKDYKNVQILHLAKNCGPSKARNEGMKLVSGKYVAFLDNDTEVHKEWIKTAVEKFESDSKVGAIQCKLLLAKDRTKIDYVGEYLGQNGFLVQTVRAGDLDNGQFEKETLILAAKSAGMFIRKAAFDLIGGFDPDYFMFVEETDLGWRVWLKGFKCVYLPTSIVYHEFGTSLVLLSAFENQYNSKFHGCKNYIMTLIKNLEVKSMFFMLPVHVFLWMGLGIYSLAKGHFDSFKFIYMGILWNIVNLGKTLAKRKKIQDGRKISDEDLFKMVLKVKPLSYFLDKVLVPHKVGNAEGFIKTKKK